MISADLPRHKYWFMLRGVAMGSVWIGVLASAASGALCLLLERYGLLPGTVSSLPFNDIAIPLGVFLSFRATQGYDRYWEARKLWGTLVNTCRSFTRQVLGLMPAEASKEQRAAVHRVIAFVYALRAHLSGQGDPVQQAQPFLAQEDLETLRHAHNVPNALLTPLGAWLRSATKRGWLHPMHLPVLEEQVTTMTTVLGACERILGTPLPVPFSLLAHRLVAMYCLLLPVVIVDVAGNYTPLIAAAVGFAFFGLDNIAGEIAHPFRPGPNQLPLLTMSRTIEIDLRQALGETEVPQIPEPIGTHVP
jgi:putative membrane protein